MPDPVSITVVDESSPTWPSVRAFAQRMERKLAANRHKGGREGWLQEHPLTLLRLLYVELGELNYAMDRMESGEAADVANFAMMIADRVTNYGH